MTESLSYGVPQTKLRCSVRKITISQEEYDKLLRDSEFLARLEHAGVDNWEGYEFALEEDEDEEDDDFR